MRTRLAVLGTGLIVTLLLPLGAAAGTAADEEQPSGRLVLLLDSSGSMKDPSSGGTTKIEAAKAALNDVADKLPDGAEVGVRVFGATVENRSLKGACTDTQNVVPVGPVDRDAIKKAVSSYKPYGETPIGNALKGAAADLGPARDGERRTIVLLSDGEPTCAPDPCQVARQLKDRGIDLRINVVGLDVSGKARQALQCIARNGGGRYVDASSAEDLTDSMVQVSVRGLREFTLSGERVEGGTSTASPAEVEPGDYIDTTLPSKAPKFYLVDKPEGGGISAGVTMRPERGENLADTTQIQLLTPDGARCADGYGQDLNLLGLRSIIGVAAWYSPVEGRAQESCADAEQMLVQVTFGGPVSDFNLQVRAYPEVTDEDELPPAVEEDEDTWERPVQLTGQGTPIIGGATFEDAPTLEPGTTYSDTLRPREQLIYKVPVGWGQSPRMTARVESDPIAADLQGILGVQVRASSFNPLQSEQQLTTNSTTGASALERYSGDRPVTVTAAQPPVRLLNLQSSDSAIQDNALAGDYYFTVQMGGDTERAAERFAAPIRIAVALDGEVEGEPSFADDVAGESESASPSPSPTAEKPSSAESDDDGFPFWMVGAGVAILAGVAVALGAAFWLGKRQR